MQSLLNRVKFISKPEDNALNKKFKLVMSLASNPVISVLDSGLPKKRRAVFPSFVDPNHGFGLSTSNPMSFFDVVGYFLDLSLILCASSLPFFYAQLGAYMKKATNSRVESGHTKTISVMIVNESVSVKTLQTFPSTIVSNSSCFTDTVLILQPVANKYFVS